MLLRTDILFDFPEKGGSTPLSVTNGLFWLCFMLLNYFYSGWNGDFVV
jgi:hypothetical protein